MAGSGGPPRDGYFPIRIREIMPSLDKGNTGAGSKVSRGPMSAKTKSRITRAVYKAAKKEARSINRETSMKKHYQEMHARQERAIIQERSNSDTYTTRKEDAMLGIHVRAANTRKGKGPSVAYSTDTPLYLTRGNPFRSAFSMKMEAARKGRTKGGKMVGDNENNPRKKR